MPEKSKSRIESNELVYRGRVLELRKVMIRTPGGDRIARDLVHYNGAAVVLPVLDDGRIVLIRNYRFAVDEHLWELCAGMIDEGESPDAAAARELIEETGYRAGRIQKLGQFFAAPGTSDEVMHAFLATELHEGEQELEKYEEIAVELFTQEQVRQMIRSGEIHDAKTIAALALYWTCPPTGK